MTILIQLIKSHARDNLIRVLIRSNRDLMDQANAMGSTPLIEAIKCVRVDIALFLIQQGADIHVRDRSCYGDTALSWAVYLGNSILVQTLLNLHADVNLQTKLYGNTLLLWACKRQYYNIFVLLMRKGADPTITSYSGESVSGLCVTTPFRTVLDEWKLEMSIAIHGYMDRWSKSRNYERGITRHVVSFLF